LIFLHLTSLAATRYPEEKLSAAVINGFKQLSGMALPKPLKNRVEMKEFEYGREYECAQNKLLATALALRHRIVNVPGELKQQERELNILMKEYEEK
jgi:hypothetical protein